MVFGMKIANMTVIEAVAGLQAGEFSSCELTGALLESIAEREPTLRAYLSVDCEQALASAAEADERRSSGVGGALLGVPLAVKDVINVKGEICSCGSRMLEGYRAPFDATVIARLREAGAIFVGRTNTDEFAMGSSTENSAFQVTRNPHDESCVAGGSSGGSAAAVAGGVALAALGTDTGGSIRQPAAFCGCVGLKPSYGRVSRYGVVGYGSSLDQCGPITRSVGDAALLLGVMAGVDERDTTSMAADVPDYKAALQGEMQGLRIGVPREYFEFEGADAEVIGEVERALQRCESAGAELVEISLPHFIYGLPSYFVISTAEASATLARFDGVRFGRRTEGVESVYDLYARSRGEGFGMEVKRRLLLGTHVLGSGNYESMFVKAQRVRTLIRGDFEAAFGQCDVVMTPVTPTVAFKVGARDKNPLTMYNGDIFTAGINLAGLCGISVPCGVGEAGLPVGLQIVGRRGDEFGVLRAAAAFEREAGA